MWLFWENWKHRRELRRLRLEREWKKILCTHHYVDIGPKTIRTSTQYDSYNTTYYQLYCPLCDTEFEYEAEAAAKRELLKQQARDEARKD